MQHEILIALISGLCVGIPSIFATIMLNNKNQAVINAKMEESQKFMEYKISELTKKVDKHNNLVERMALQERESKAMWKQIDKLKGEDK